MSINATLIAQIIVFGILVWFTMKFIWPPITKAMEERSSASPTVFPRPIVRKLS